MNEAEVLRKALMRFGIGNWSKIIESNCLVGKTNAQMNLQTQRMLGQQSTAGKEEEHKRLFCYCRPFCLCIHRSVVCLLFFLP